LIELSIESIRVSLMNYQRVVILREKSSDRYLCIWIGPAEADAIAVQLQEVAVARPLTHDLLRQVIDQLGAQVSHILVNDLANDTFYAKIVLDVNGNSMEVDSRPSDAIALAVRAKVRADGPRESRSGRDRAHVRVQGLHREPRPRRLRQAQQELSFDALVREELARRHVPVLLTTLRPKA
jgi:bifunctional DNase/RNase